jgi:hypothetical protein
VSVTDRDASVLQGAALDSARPLDRFARALCEAGLRIQACRTATDAEVDELGSTWAKRLGIPRRRAATVLVAHKRK